MEINTNKLGLVLAVMLGGVHVVWSIFVLLGWGQPLLDFIFWAHMFSMPVIVMPFDGLASISLIAITSALGYLAGCVLGTVWNKVQVKD
ncbi:MAG: hypothetical protein M0P64_01940 [Candidatus Pacebacteria bacterium]|jgi:hypothetical protein|nr:hypothetical protein [Candidatus Paceibacterota bacterium]